MDVDNRWHDEITAVLVFGFTATDIHLIVRTAHPEKSHLLTHLFKTKLRVHSETKGKKKLNYFEHLRSFVRVTTFKIGKETCMDSTRDQLRGQLRLQAVGRYLHWCRLLSQDRKQSRRMPDPTGCNVSLFPSKCRIWKPAITISCRGCPLFLTR